jgi:hypothetical protein
MEYSSADLDNRRRSARGNRIPGSRIFVLPESSHTSFKIRGDSNQYWESARRIDGVSAMLIGAISAASFSRLVSLDTSNRFSSFTLKSKSRSLTEA